MIIKIFKAGKGDCLLITSDNANILVDGGVAPAYTAFVAAELSKLRKENKQLDLACVSHIDDDHIGGFLKMIEDEVEWRVYDYHKEQGNTHVKVPKSPRPPEIREIWHNAFHEQIKDNAGDIENILARTADILSASNHPILCEMGEIAYSKGQAIQLSRRLRPGQLNIPLNEQYEGKLVMYREQAPSFQYGDLSLTVIAPFPDDLDNLKTEWNDWLRTNKAQIKKIKEKVEKDRDLLTTTAFGDIEFYSAMADEMGPLLLSQLDLHQATKILGKREKVTTPNLASIMFLLEEEGKTLLMTGDGHWEDILKGLEAIGRIDPDKGLHLDVIKVPHHLSEHNTCDEFYNKITADHYICCANGAHENPDLDVIQSIIDSRTTKPAITDEVDNKFTLWFNSSTDATDASYKAHMTKVEKLVEKMAKQHKQLKATFIQPGKNYLKLQV